VPHLVAYCCFAVFCSLAHVFALAARDCGAEVFAPAVIQCAKYSASTKNALNRGRRMFLQDCLELSSNTFPPRVFISLLSSQQFIATVSRMLPERPAIGETQPPGNTLHTWWRILRNRLSNRTDDFTDSRVAIKANLLANGAAKGPGICSTYIMHSASPGCLQAYSRRSFVPRSTIRGEVCQLLANHRFVPCGRSLLAGSLVHSWCSSIGGRVPQDWARAARPTPRAAVF
jgi:hypothetical protein